MKKLLPIAALLSTACVDTLGKDSATGNGDGMEVSVTWGASAVSLSVTGGDVNASYQWGLAETGSTCNNGAGDCWTGEDCLDGYSTSGGNTFTYCHSVSNGSASLNYGGSFENLAESQETVFGDNSFDGSVTYILDDTVSGDCWVWGQDTGYYDGLGCNELQ